MAENQGSSAAEKLTFLLIGGGIGATLALLFAPKTGRELRGDIADYTKRGVDAAGEQARDLSRRILAVPMWRSPVRKIFSAFSQEHRRFPDLMLVSATSPLAQSDLQGLPGSAGTLACWRCARNGKMQARMPALPGG